MSDFWEGLGKHASVQFVGGAASAAGRKVIDSISTSSLSDMDSDMDGILSDLKKLQGRSAQNRKVLDALLAKNGKDEEYNAPIIKRSRLLQPHTERERLEAERERLEAERKRLEAEPGE